MNKPDFSENKTVLFNDDCIEILKQMPKESVDLIITDPPYKITARGNGGNSGGMFQKKEVNTGKVFENNDLEIEDWLPLLYNVLKPQSHCYIMTNNKNITHYLKVIDEMYFNDDKKQKFHFIKNLIWVKDNKIMGQTYMSQFEYIIMLRKGGHKIINDCGTSDVLQFPNKKLKKDGETIHDTEKPVELLKILIKNSAKKDDIVLDPFVGIGSTCIASSELGIKSIGIEVNKNYFDVAVDRIKMLNKGE